MSSTSDYLVKSPYPRPRELDADPFTVYQREEPSGGLDPIALIGKCLKSPVPFNPSDPKYGSTLFRTAALDASMKASACVGGRPSDEYYDHLLVSEEPIALRPLRVDDISVTMFAHASDADTDTESSNSSPYIDNQPSTTILSHPQPTLCLKPAAPPSALNLDLRAGHFGFKVPGISPTAGEKEVCQYCAGRLDFLRFGETCHAHADDVSYV